MRRALISNHFRCWRRLEGSECPGDNVNAERLKAIVRGAVQGVGFRPFIYGLATRLGLSGWVSNTAQGVFIEVEGSRPLLNEFLLRLEKEKPARSIIQSLEFSFLEASGYAGFEIRPSDDHGKKTAFVLPDIATCADCLLELFDPGNRRYLYPFTNCTHCGPRFSIIEALPYDRPNTSMKDFLMCAECEGEYHDPADRRFHAQPNACPTCGPRLQLWDRAGRPLGERHDALLRAAAAIREGKILALKGIGGFQLIVDARNEEAVRRLRLGKCREEKPFALMYPGLEMLREDTFLDEFEARLLSSPEAPIVLLRRKEGAVRLALSVAPANPNIGAMLPGSPLHHVLLRELAFPVVATSGNLSEEPICIDESEALKRLGNAADLLLVHNRSIVRQVDDSVARVVLGREMLLRRARGYAPLPIHLRQQVPPVLAVGPHLKNTVALGIGNEVFLSQHIGDLETPEAWLAFRRVLTDLQKFYEFTAETVACDLHEEYFSTQHARTLAKPLVRVQHHYAHVLACMAENELEGPALGVSWDGTGLGVDGTIWGGEFLLIDPAVEINRSETPFIRVAHLRNFRLPGGEAAIRQPRRAALGLLWEIFGEELFERADTLAVRQFFSESESNVIRQMLGRGVNSPLTSSAGRLFDAVASIVGVRQWTRFEGQAAMALEFILQSGVDTSYAFSIGEDGIVDWQPMILQILKETQAGEPVGRIAASFHNTLAEMMIAAARRAGVRQVVLTGGCFQNKYLLERAVRRLEQENFQPSWHQRVPPNDGGIALGQVMAAARVTRLRPKTKAVSYA
jgi:hydrogenase maturation protein HypF